MSTPSTTARVQHFHDKAGRLVLTIATLRLGDGNVRVAAAVANSKDVKHPNAKNVITRAEGRRVAIERLLGFDNSAPEKVLVLPEEELAAMVKDRSIVKRVSCLKKSKIRKPKPAQV